MVNETSAHGEAGQCGGVGEGLGVGCAAWGRGGYRGWKRRERRRGGLLKIPMELDDG